MAGRLMPAGSPRLRRIRVAGWLGFIVLVAIGEAIALSPLAAANRQLMADVVTYLTPIALSLVTACVLVWRCKDFERRLWSMIAVACGFLLLSESYMTWYVYAVDWRGPTLPAYFQLLQLGAAVTFLVIIDTMTLGGDASSVKRVRFVIDVLAALVVVTAASYWWVVLPMLRAIPGTTAASAAASSVYTPIGLLLLAGAGAMLLGWRVYRWRSWERLLIAALALYGFAIMFSPFWYVDMVQTPYPPEVGVQSNLYGFGVYLLFMAMVYRMTTGDGVSLVARWTVVSTRSTWFSTVYPVALACALPVMGWVCLSVGHVPAGLFMVVLTCALALLLVARSWLSSYERLHLHGLAITDPISGAFNHRYFYERSAEQFSQLQHGRELALLALDVDDFAHINHVWGHKRGDELLRAIAEVIASPAAIQATVYRVGSDEFAVLLADSDDDDAMEFARGAQSRVAALEILPGTQVGLSVGIAFYPRHGDGIDVVLQRAVAAQQLARTTESIEPVVYDEDVVGSVDPVERLAAARRRSHRAVVLALAEAVDARYEDTKEHSENVAQLATSLAQVLGMSEASVRSLALAAQVHDVGKIGVRDEVLLKEGLLSPDERRLVEEHSALGERILAPMELGDILPLVRNHHERWDGMGYPDQLRGPQIPVGARILAVCDAFEAMTSPRPYRGAMTFEQAIEEIELRSGSQFDPEVAATFVRMVTQLRTPVAGQTASSG